MTSRIPEPPSGAEAEGQPDPDPSLATQKATGDAMEGMEPPHDYPMAVDDYGTTAAEQRDGESLDLRLTREEPEVDPRDPGDGSEYSDTPFAEGAGQGVGRVVEPDEGARTDDEADVVAADRGTDGGGFTAEESAMHLEPEA